MKKSEFVLQYIHNNRFFCEGESTPYGAVLESTKDIEEAKKFDSYKYAVSYKNNESHIRHDPMRIIELRATIQKVNRGEVPLQKPSWEDFDQSYDDYCAEQRKETYSKLIKQKGKAQAHGAKEVI